MVFILIIIKQTYLIKTDTPAFWRIYLHFFRICPIYFHSSRKFSLRVVLSFWLKFCQFQPFVAYESVAFKKKHVFHLLNFLESKVVVLFVNIHTLVKEVYKFMYK